MDIAGVPWRSAARKPSAIVRLGRRRLPALPSAPLPRRTGHCSRMHCHWAGGRDSWLPGSMPRVGPGPGQGGHGSDAGQTAAAPTWSLTHFVERSVAPEVALTRLMGPTSIVSRDFQASFLRHVWSRRGERPSVCALQRMPSAPRHRLGKRKPDLQGPFGFLHPGSMSQDLSHRYNDALFRVCQRWGNGLTRSIEGVVCRSGRELQSSNVIRARLHDSTRFDRSSFRRLALPINGA